MDSGKEYNLGSFLKFPLLEINPNYNKASNQKQNTFNKKDEYNTNKVNNYNINEYADKNNNIENFN